MITDRIDKKQLATLQELIAAKDNNRVLSMLEDLHPEDIADIFYDISLDDAKYIVEVLHEDTAVSVVRALDEDILARFFKGYEADQIAHLFIQNLDSDDAVDMINVLPIQKANEVLSFLEDKDFAGQIISLLHYPDNSAGGLMAKELIKVNLNQTVSECIEAIRDQAENVSKIYTIYAVDEFDKLLGTVSLKEVILNRGNTKVGQIIKNNDSLIKVNVYDDSEYVAATMYKYDLDAIPVVDALDRLQGRITIDDIVDFSKEEADKDYQMASGISENVEATDKVWILSRARLPWLVVGLVGGILTSGILSNYEPAISAFPKLAFFMPLVAAMGGNAGVQSSAIVVQGLANNTIGSEAIFPKLGKEFLVALINGLICSALLLTWNIVTGLDYNLGLTVSIALISVIIFACILGTITPLILNKLNIDPALATGPFITTTNDILGLSIYFFIGGLLI